MQSLVFSLDLMWSRKKIIERGDLQSVVHFSTT